MDSCVDVALLLEWASESPAGPVQHRDAYFAGAVDPGADRLPDGLAAALITAEPGERIELRTDIDGLRGHDETKVAIHAARPRFTGTLPDGRTVTPRFGRFYSNAMFEGIGPPGGDPGWPIRFLGEAEGTTAVDARHPLAGRELTLTAEIVGPGDAAHRDTAPVDWTARLIDGPGMQACWGGKPTAFACNDAYAREDEGPDSGLYATASMVTCLDAQARVAVGDYYRGVLDADATALDLLSSRDSYLAADAKPARLIGLGLNTEEMHANEMLDGAVVADLNHTPVLPFADSAFDAVICSVSVEYLTQPVEVFREANRALRPGSVFALTFSNRWLPPKVTRLWTELHDFERIALVANYFAEAGGFTGIETYSLRGLPRPPDDVFAAEIPHADPVFAVCARRVGRAGGPS